VGRSSSFLLLLPGNGSAGARPPPEGVFQLVIQYGSSYREEGLNSIPVPMHLLLLLLPQQNLWGGLAQTFLFRSAPVSRPTALRRRVFDPLSPQPTPVGDLHRMDPELRTQLTQRFLSPHRLGRHPGFELRTVLFFRRHRSSPVHQPRDLILLGGLKTGVHYRFSSVLGQKTLKYLSVSHWLTLWLYCRHSSRLTLR